MLDKKKRVLNLIRKFYHTIYFIVVIVLVFFFYPRQGRFKYEFQKGKPWLDQTLIAQFDFPILKAKVDLDAEKDSVLRNFIPYFKLDPTIEGKEIAKLQNDLDELLTGVHGYPTGVVQSTKNAIIDLYKNFYEKGILANSAQSYEFMDGRAQLYIVQNSKASKIDVENVFSLKSAYILANEKLKEWSVSNRALLSVYQKFDLNQYLMPNLEYDQTMSETRKNELFANIANTRGVVQTGARIISQGEMVTNANYNILDSYRQAYLQKQAYGGLLAPVMIGNMILVLVLMLLLVIYLQNYNRSIFERKRNYSLILTLIALFFIITKLIYNNESTSIYIIPFCILPIVIRTFLGARMAIFIHILFLFMVSGMAENSFEFTFIQMVAGTISVISLNTLHKRGNLIITSLMAMVSYGIVSIGFLLAEGSTFSLDQLKEYSWIPISSLLIMLAYLIIYVFERIFGFISDVTLMEISDTNNPLLRKLAEEAPGTFQHSMQVANLAEEVVARTSGNPLLIRAGALYHDVGKIANAQYFIENQTVGENPHAALSHFESAKKIIAHINDGVTLARKYKIPETIIDFIKMHHGRSLARFFYLKYKEANPGVEVSTNEFMYPGPNPNTRETAILMLADGVEAATRSLPVKNEETLKKMIDQVIDTRVNNHELDDSPLTFKDIKLIKSIFLAKLKNIYHVRIEYPTEK
jgi:cyclic-di-AMP phosphodiesterase PgpH